MTPGNGGISGHRMGDSFGTGSFPRPVFSFRAKLAVPFERGNCPYLTPSGVLIWIRVDLTRCGHVRIIMAQVAVPHFINDPVHWHERAEEARALAEQMKDEVTKQTMLGLAQDYDRLAVRASIRLGDKE
jgi:hypothetical protein